MRGAFFLLFLVLVSAVSGAGVREGMTRDEVEAALGRPTSVLAKNGREILLYPGGGRVELAEGRLVSAVKVERDLGLASPATQPQVAGGAENATATSVVSPPKPVPAPPGAPSSEDVEVYGAPSGAQQLLEKSLEDLSRGQPVPGQAPKAVPVERFWLKLLVQAAAQLLATAVVLKFSFAWADVHADWSQMWIPALAESGAALLVQVVAFAAWGATELFYMDQAFAFAVLLGVLMKTTHACTWARAAGVAVTTKTVGVGLRYLLGAIAAHAL